MSDQGGIEDLLRRREKIDGELSQFKKPIAVMFADIKSSTDYFDRWGDLEGRLMVQRCENVMIPVLESRGAKTIKKLGDGVMAYFENAESAVRSAMEIQQGMLAHNRDKEERLQLHLRIGINYGLAIVETSDISGDVVNVAKRVESLATVDGICISRSTYEQVRHLDEIICRYVGEREVKGKAEPIRVYQVKWTEEEMTVGPLRSVPASGGPVGEEDGRCFFLDVHSEGSKVRVRSHEGSRGEEKTLQFYEDVNISLEKVENYAQQIKGLLGRANRSGKVGGEILASLKQTGQLLYEELLPPRTRDRLNNTNVQSLVLNLDDSLVHIPWELVYDGRDFLCQRFSMGRVVSTRQDVKAAQRELGIPLRMLLLADPQGNLPSSYAEGVAVRDMLDRSGDTINASLKTSGITTEYVKAKLRYFDILHYAGHAEYDTNNPSRSGFLLSDGRLGAEEITNMVGRMPFPSLVVSNACKSGETDEWKIGSGYEKVFGLANAFLLSGVRHYVGTFWDIQDEPSQYFSIMFYETMLNGASVGEAVRRGRRALMEKYGEDTIVWASYLLYGDPTFRYIKKSVQPLAAGRAAPEQGVPAGAFRASAEDDVVVFPSPKKGVPVAALVGLLLAVTLAVGLFMMHRGSTPSTPIVTVQPVVPAVSPEQEKERAQRIDTLVEELAAKFRAEGDPGPVETSDDWTSSPVSIVFLGVKAEGMSDMEKDFLLAKIVADLQDAGRVRVVERELLDKLLSELKLSASDLADSRNTLRLGKILSARLIATGGIIRSDGEWMANLRIIETETSAIKAAITSTTASADRSAVAADLAYRIGEQIRDWYPVRGKVSAVEGHTITINIGKNVGLTKGTRLNLLSEDLSPTGELEVVGVEADSARVRKIAGPGTVTPGTRVAGDSL